MKGLRRSFYYISLFFDLIVLLFSFAAADLVSRWRFPAGMRETIKEFSLPEIFTLLVFMSVWYLSSRATSLYDELKNYNFSSEIYILFKNILIQMIAGVIILFSLKNILLSRVFLMLYLALLFISALIIRSGSRLIRKILVRKGVIRNHILIIGSGESGRDIFYSQGREEVTGYSVLGYISDSPVQNGISHVGGFSDIAAVIENNQIDEIIIALKDEESSELNRILKILSGFPVRARIIPEYSKFISNRYLFIFTLNFCNFSYTISCYSINIFKRVEKRIVRKENF